MADVILTPEGTISHPNVFTARLPKDPKPDDKPTFNCVIVFTHDAMKTAAFKALQAEAMRKLREKFGEKTEALLREGSLQTPFKKDLVKKGYDPEVYGCYINISAGQDYPPAILGPNRQKLLDKREVYPGAKVVVSVVSYTYDQRGNSGVKFGLRNIMKVGDGPRLDSSVSAEDEFASVAVDPAAASAGGDDIDALMG